MLIKNIGPLKDIKIDGIFLKIKTGINFVKDLPILKNIIGKHPDLSVVTEADIKKAAEQAIQPKPVVKEEVKTVVKEEVKSAGKKYKGNK